MLSKLNTKTLLLLLVALVALFAILYFSDNTESSYKSEIVNLDTASVNRIVIEVPGKDTINLVKENTGWKLLEKGVKADADNNKIKALLNRMAPLKTARLATNNKKHWEKYGVAENDKYTGISFYNGNKLISKVFLGKVDFQAPEETDNQNPYMRNNRGTMIGYARTSDDDNVYVVDGYLKLTFAGDKNGYRKKNIIKADPKSISEVNVQSGKAKFTLKKDNDYWTVDGAKADSANTAKFINNISRLNGYSFYSKKDIEGVKPVGTVTVKLPGSLIKVDAYAIDSTDFALVSTQNENNIIRDKKGRIFERLFKEKGYFLEKAK